MRLFAIGFTLRLIIATVISMAVWRLFITPFDRLPLPRSAVIIIGRVLDFPVALAGELLPIRGMELVFEDHATWCDFCQPGEMFRLQMRIAIPTYILVLYLPNLLRWAARRNARLFKRAVIGLLFYAVFTIAFILVTGSSDRRQDLRTAAVWLLILSAAAAVAWSKIEQRWKFAAVVAVLLAGAWTSPFMMMIFIAPKEDQVRTYFVSDLVLLIFGVGGTLSLTWAVENGIERWRRRRVGE